ncbi:MAG: hypothetical protein A2051_05140 [Desulfovibrionales bacterium GWA2_65_9]|nr:MAG: hypothetical protein A2051_05140 [Desulfovibrionales bacterium GWA2_65_9]
MKIGLARHYDVNVRRPGTGCLLTPRQFIEFVQAYDGATCIKPQSRLDTGQFSACLSSDLPRALHTAEHMHSGRITVTPELRELAIHPFTQRHVRLPLFLWLIFGRLAWLLSHKSQVESKRLLSQRVGRVVDAIVNSGNADILIVTHGITMYFLRKELRRRGFKGPGWRIASKGVVLLYERSEDGVR